MLSIYSCKVNTNCCNKRNKSERMVIWRLKFWIKEYGCEAICGIRNGYAFKHADNYRHFS